MDTFVNPCPYVEDPISPDEWAIINTTRGPVVYLIEGDMLTKIGHTTNLLTRLRTIRGACPVPVTLMGAVSADRRYEQACHARYAQYRIRFEWFDLTAEQRQDILEGAPR